MKRKSQAGLQCITKFFKAENIGGKTPTSSPEKLFREQPEPEEEVLFLVDAPDPLELAMNRERGADFRGFRPQRFRGGMRPWGSARRGTLPVRRRPTRGFPPFIGSSGSDRSFHRVRPGDDRLQPRSQDKFRDDRPRLNSPDSDTESVASEFNANSARYKQSGIVGRQSSLTQANSPAVKRSESAKRHGLLETPARHGGQDIGHLNEQFGRQSLNESAMDDFVFVERRGRQGHIQRGLMRVVGGDSRGRIIGSPSFGRGRGFSGQRSTADNSGSWGTTGRDESPREKLMNRVPREKKQQASWIPLEEEEKKTTEVVQCATPEKIKVDDQCKQMSKGVLNPQVTCDQDFKLGIDRTPESKKSSDGRSSSQQTTCGTLMTRDLQPKEAFFKNVQQNLTGQNLSSGNESKQDDLGYWKGLGDSEDTDVSSTSTSVLSTAIAPQTASKTEPPEGATRSFVTPLSFSSFEGTRGRLDEPSQTAPSSVLHRPTYDLQPVVTSVTSTSSIHTSPARHSNLSKTSVVTSQCMKPEPSVEIPIPGGDLVLHEDDMENETRSTSLQRNDKTGSNKNAERDFIDSVKPLKINQRSCSDQGSLNVSGDVKSPAHPSTSNNSPDMRRVGAHTMPLSFSSFGLGCQGPLSADKVRGLSHNDVSDWVKKSTKHQPFDSEGHSGQCRTTVKKKHRHRDKRRHCSGSSTFNRSADKDINRTEGGKYGTKAPKSCDSDIQQLVDDSLRNKEILKSRSVDESDESSGIPKTESEPQKTPLKSQLLLDSSRMSKFKANLAKSPLMKSKSPTKWAPDTSNPLGSYRIPKKSSAHDEDKKLKDGCKSKGQTKSEDDSSPASSSESDDDMLNETPAFLKEFEETSKAILNTEAMPGTPENENNESNQSDDSLFQQEGPVSCHPVTQPTDKSTFSLDTLLAEKVENEETDRELNVMQKELKDVIKKGGFVRLAEADFDGSDDELLPEHHQKLQHFQVSENTIQEHHPGDVVLHTGRFPCVYSESLTPLRCGLQPSMNFIERHLADIQPDALSDLLTTDMLSMCFHKLTSQKEVLRWIFLIMCVHDDSCVVHGCKKLIFDIIHSQLGVDETSSTWAPSITDLLKVLINFGGDAQELLGNQTLYSETDIREAVLPENDVNLVQGQGNMSERSYAENIRECLQTVAFALQGRPPYTAAELNVLLLMIAKLAMEKEFTQNMLLYEFTVVINSLLPCYQDEDWTSVMPGLCYQLSEITQHHHNLVYLSQLFHHSHRSSCLQRRLAYTLLNKMLQPSVTIPPQFLIHFKLRNLCVFFPMLRDLAADDLYALSSAICLMDIAVGNEPVKGPEKADLQYLMELLRTLTSDVRDNVRRLDHTRVKDLMVRISSKWTVTLQTTFSKQRNLFAWTKQKSPQKMKVQRLETGASDVESDEEEGEEESGPVPMEEDNGAGGESASDIDTKSQITQHDVPATDKKQLELDSGDAVVEDGDRTIKICANKNNQVSENSVDKNSTLTISVSSSRNTDYIDNVNCDNHTRVEGNDVSSRQLHKDKTSQPGGRQGATIVIEDVLEKTDDVSMSSEDESLPELDISL